MRLCKVWDADYPWDVRVEKICDSLVESGHEVHLVCRNVRRRPTTERNGLLTIHRLPRWTGGSLSPLGFPFFLNPLWLWRIYWTLRQSKADVILVRDLPMAPAAVLVGWITRTKCAIDMAEPYPEMLEGYEQLQRVSISKRILNTLVRNSRFARKVESFVCRRVGKIFPVSVEIGTNLNLSGSDSGKITVVHNTPRLREIDGLRACQNGSDASSRELRVVYVGDLTEARGVPVAVDAIAELRRLGLHYRLVIIGKGRFEPMIRSAVVAKNVEDMVDFLGFVPHEKLAIELAKCHIGVIPHVSTKHNNLTIPNKVFDYMALGLPVVTADLVPISRIVRETGSGLVYAAGDSMSLAEALRLLSDTDMRSRLGAAGVNAAVSQYNWDQDYRQMEASLLNLSGSAG